MNDWLGILRDPLPVHEACNYVLDEAAGGIDIFLGTVRGETSSEGRALAALDYEAYEEMVLRQLAEVAARAREQWPIMKLAVLHRLGRVPVGQPSVLVAASTPHRAECFAACQYLIDGLKRDAAIWKTPVWSE